MLNKGLVFLLMVALTGCAAHRPFGKPLYAEEAAKIKTIEIVVIAKDEPLNVYQQRHDDIAGTSALQTVGGGLGLLVAGIISSNADRRNANIAEQIRQQTLPLLSQVSEINYRKTLIDRLKASLKLDGSIQVAKIVEWPLLKKIQQVEYANKSSADAVLFVNASSDFSGSIDMDLTQNAIINIVSKGGKTVFNTMLFFYAPEAGTTTIAEGAEWWASENRYRAAVLHSMYAISAALNEQIFLRPHFLTPEEAETQTEREKIKAPSRARQLEIKKLRQCARMPASESFNAKNYLVEQNFVGFSVTLVCAS